MEATTKTCFTCKETKPTAEFTTNKAHRGGLASNCKACIRVRGLKRYAEQKDRMIAASKRWKAANPERTRALHKKSRDRRPHVALNYRLWSEFGITLAQYEEKLRAQKGVCAICSSPETVMSRGRLRRLAVDHNHQTGKVRDLLCMRCNMEVGIIEDKARLSRILAYLTRHSPESPDA